MLYLYLYESGDLGFDFKDKTPSEYFTAAVMLVHGEENRKKIHKAIKLTIKTKLQKTKGNELKGSKQSIEVKRYFYKHIEAADFELYALTINKKHLYKNCPQNKDIVYNLIVEKILDVIPWLF
ncbi:hypothetical protein MCHI_001509 [Candidatus Magnetoovum chiemensis]|nr:hypothetical protein MCHI_001509 [Candidatus Magnetoovum chiemensis]